MSFDYIAYNNILDNLFLSPHWDYFYIIYFPISFAMFLLPGLIAVKSFCANDELNEADIPYSAFGISVLIGYLFFYLYYISPIIGYLSSWAMTIFILIYVFKKDRARALWKMIGSFEVKTPIILMFFVGLLYIAYLYSGRFGWQDFTSPEDRGFILARIGAIKGSPDYLQQKMIATFLMNGSSFWNQVLDTYQTTLADRPPTLAGVGLMMPTIGRFWSSSELPDLLYHSLFYYQFMVVSTIAQLIWIPVLWRIFRLSSLTRAQSATLLIVFAHTGFFFIYSVFTWPKLIAGALYVGAFILFVQKPLTSKVPLNTTETIIGSMLAALSFLCHMGGGIMILFLGITLLFRPIKPLKKNIAIGMIVFLVLVMPWLYMKKSHEPNKPGLARYLLTITGEDNNLIYFDMKLTTLQAVAKVYEKMSAKEIISNKLASTFSLIQSGLPLAPYSQLHSISLAELRDFLKSLDFDHILRTFGPFHLGWFLFLPLPLLKHRKHTAMEEQATHNALKIMLAISIVSILVTNIMSYRVCTTLYYFPLSAVILIFTFLAIKIIQASKWVIISVSATSVGYFMWAYVFLIPGDGLRINWIISIVALSAYGLLWYVPFSMRQKKPPEKLPHHNDSLTDCQSL